MHGNLHKVDGLHERRCLKIQSSSNIKIEELIIVNGFASDFGGGVLAESSTLIMLRCVIMGSVANIGGGGLGLTAGGYHHVSFWGFVRSFISLLNRSAATRAVSRRICLREVNWFQP